jgi:hypothetical protein
MVVVMVTLALAATAGFVGLGRRRTSPRADLARSERAA